MVLYQANFIDPDELVKFVAAEAIPQDNIQAIVVQRNRLVLFYWA